MDRRPDFHRVLKALFDENPHVYFQPPKNTMLQYPCIIYKLVDIPAKYANNRRYIQKREYEVTVIDRDPDSPLREKILGLMTDGHADDPEWDPFNFETDYDLHRLLVRILRSMGHLFMGRFVRFFVSEGLNHYVFKIYY